MTSSQGGQKMGVQGVFACLPGTVYRLQDLEGSCRDKMSVLSLVHAPQTLRQITLQQEDGVWPPCALQLGAREC